MVSDSSCAKCGTPLPGDAPAGQCPSCLLGLADEPHPESRETGQPSFKPHDREFGDYRLGRQLGSGGMGIVYEAHQVSLNRAVAIKFIRDSQVASPMLLRRFTIEAEATARLHHPNIVGIYEIGEIDGQPYFSMELVEGESLRALLAKGDFKHCPDDSTRSGERTRQTAIARLIARTARALHHAHQRGVLHRDIKPGNILLERGGEPRLTDFGLAKILRQTTDTGTGQSLTGTGDIAGTPGYMSPEQATSLEATSASDVYGLGAVLYEMLTGHLPFRGNTALETLDLVRNSAPRNPRSHNRLIDPGLEIICLKCIEKEPSRRYASAEALAEDLENWIDHKPIKARRASPAVRSLHWMKRNRTGTALIAVLLVCLAMAFALLVVINQKKKEADKRLAAAALAKLAELTDRWKEPNTTRLPITSSDLAVLGNRDPVEAAAARQVSLSITIRGDPINFVQHFAEFAGRLERRMSTAVGESVQFNLVLAKHGVSVADLLATNNVDFALLQAPAFVQAQAKEPRLLALARLPGATTGVLISRRGSPVTALEQLRGKSVHISNLTAPTTLAAKAHLIGQGLSSREVGFTNNEAPVSGRVSSRGVMAAVITGRADAGVGMLGKFQREEHKGLVLLARFPIPHRILGARPGLDAQVVSAFQSALLAEGISIPRQEANDEPDWEESATFGVVKVDEAYLTTVREMLRAAARFDGQPDPFPPTAKPPAGGQ